MSDPQFAELMSALRRIENLLERTGSAPAAYRTPVQRQRDLDELREYRQRERQKELSRSRSPRF